MAAALEEIKDCRKMARELGDLLLEAEACDVEGMLAHELGFYEEAEASLQEAQRLFRACAVEYDALWSEAFLGWVRLGRGKFQEAIDGLQEVLEQAEIKGYRSIISHCVGGMADGHRYLEHWERAEELYGYAQQVDREMGSRHGDMTVQLNRAILAIGRGEDLETARFLESACQDDFEWDRYQTVVDCMNLVLIARGGDEKGLKDWLGEKGEKGEWEELELLWRDQPWLIDLAIEALDSQEMGEIQDRLKKLAASLWRRIGDGREAEKYGLV